MLLVDGNSVWSALIVLCLVYSLYDLHKADITMCYIQCYTLQGMTSETTVHLLVDESRWDRKLQLHGSNSILFSLSFILLEASTLTVNQQGSRFRSRS